MYSPCIRLRNPMHACKRRGIFSGTEVAVVAYLACIIELVSIILYTIHVSIHACMDGSTCKLASHIAIYSLHAHWLYSCMQRIDLYGYIASMQINRIPYMQLPSYIATVKNHASSCTHGPCSIKNVAIHFRHHSYVSCMGYS